MRIRTLAREILAASWSARIPSALMAIVVAAMCFSAIATVGRSAAAAAEVAARMEQAGARLITVVDGRGLGFINDRTLQTVGRLSTVQQVDALGMPFDSVNGVIGAGGARIPTWPVLGNTANVGPLIWGRVPRPGEALISMDQLRVLNLASPAGFLQDVDTKTQYPIVGAYRAQPPFDDLAAGAIVVPSTPQTGRELRVVVDAMAAAEHTTSTVMSILAPAAVEGVYVQSPAALAQTARQINAELASSGRALLLLILGAGSLFVAAVVLTDVLVRRRDLGRRRTLGITQRDLIALVAGRALLTAMLGALVGSAIGVLANQAVGIDTPIDFTIAIGMLASLTSGITALLPAMYAARLDPVAVMRTA